MQGKRITWMIVDEVEIEGVTCPNHIFVTGMTYDITNTNTLLGHFTLSGKSAKPSHSLAFNWKRL